MSLNIPHYVHISSPYSCALISHSDRTLPRHIWFLIRLIMSNNVHGSAHPSGAPFICLDTTAGHEMSWGRKEETIVLDVIKSRIEWM